MRKHAVVGANPAGERANPLTPERLHQTMARILETLEEEGTSGHHLYALIPSEDAKGIDLRQMGTRFEHPMQWLPGTRAPRAACAAIVVIDVPHLSEMCDLHPECRSRGRLNAGPSDRVRIAIAIERASGEMWVASRLGGSSFPIATHDVLASTSPNDFLLQIAGLLARTLAVSPAELATVPEVFGRMLVQNAQTLVAEQATGRQPASGQPAEMQAAWVLASTLDALNFSNPAPWGPAPASSGMRTANLQREYASACRLLTLELLEVLGESWEDFYAHEGAHRWSREFAKTSLLTKEMHDWYGPVMLGNELHRSVPTWQDIALRFDLENPVIAAMISLVSGFGLLGVDAPAPIIRTLMRTPAHLAIHARQRPVAASLA